MLFMSQEMHATKVVSSSPVSECLDVSSSISQDFISKLMLMVDDAKDLQTEVNSDEEEEGDSDDEDFSFICLNPDGSPISADDCFHNGQIRPSFPIFDGDLLFSNPSDEDSKPKQASSLRPPLRKLFIEENVHPQPSSLSPNKFVELEEVSQERCKKSNSTGFSKIWKFRYHFVHRSNSDRKGAFDFFNNNNNPSTAVVQERHYVRNREKKAEDKRRTYLPYRQDLVGFFTNVNGLTRKTHPF